MRRINVDQFVDVSPADVLAEFYGEHEFELLGIPTLLLRPEHYVGRDIVSIVQDITPRVLSFTSRAAPGHSYERYQIEGFAGSLYYNDTVMGTATSAALRRDDGPYSGRDTSREFLFQPRRARCFHHVARRNTRHRCSGKIY